MIVPAAGLGTRLKSTTPKVLLEVKGKATIDWLLELYDSVIDRFILVLHPSFEASVREHCRNRRNISYLRQESPTGMLDAVLIPSTQNPDLQAGRIWITWCDQIAIHPATVQRLLRLSGQHPETALIFPTAQRQQPYIHLLRDVTGRITAIHHRREGDPMPQIGESDMGLFSLSMNAYRTLLPTFAAQADRAAHTGERNFLPFIPWLVAQGAEVMTFPCQDEHEAIGINTADDLTTIEHYLEARGRAVSSG